MLAALLREHRGQLSADFRRFYGCNLTDVLAGRVAPLREVAEWAANLPVESVTVRQATPQWAHTHDVELLRQAVFYLAVANWQRAGGKGRTPEPYRFPWEDRPGWHGDALEWDEAVDALGGDERLRRLMAVPA